MAWINITSWTPQLIEQHGIDVGKEPSNGLNGTHTFPGTTINDVPQSWVRATVLQHDIVTRYEFRGLTLASAEALISASGMNTISHDGAGRVTYTSVAIRNRTSEANNFTVTRTITNTTYSATFENVTGPE